MDARSRQEVEFLPRPERTSDVGYTDYQAKVAEVQSRTLDEAMQFIHHHPDFRFSVDAFWSVRQFLAERSKEQKQLLFQAVKEKEFSCRRGGKLAHGFPFARNAAPLALSGFRI